MKTTFIPIGEVIRYYRTNAKLSQASLAEGICTRKYIGMLENNICIPTLDIINQLSDRLNVNLYDTYATILHHHDIATHIKIEKLDSCFSRDQLHKLPALIHEYKDLPGFQSGEPKQFLKYAEALYLSNILSEHSMSITYDIEALKEHYPTAEALFNPQNHFSNIELSLLLHIAVNSCRLDDIDNGKKYFDLLYRHLTILLNKSHYSINRNHHFEQCFLCIVVYNQYSFFRAETDSQYSQICETIERMKSLSSTFLLPELLLCKSALEYDFGDLSGAHTTYKLANALGNFIYTPEEQHSLEILLLPHNFQKLTS